MQMARRTFQRWLMTRPCASRRLSHGELTLTVMCYFENGLSILVWWLQNVVVMTRSLGGVIFNPESLGFGYLIEVGTFEHIGNSCHRRLNFK